MILFKHGYSFLVQTAGVGPKGWSLPTHHILSIICVHLYPAGFSKNGREWMANAVVSSAIGILNFAVFANLTRFE